MHSAFCRFALSLSLFLALDALNPLHAQMSEPPPQIGPPTGLSHGIAVPGAPRHKGPAGSECLKFNADQRGFAGNPKLIEHLVRINNRCLSPIKVQLCYYKTRSCQTVTAPPLRTSFHILGAQIDVRLFYFEYKELF